MNSATRKRLNTIGLTLLFVGLFFALRAIPVSECKFLHYEAVETTGVSEPGEDELCSVAPVPFVDVVKKPHPVSLDIHSVRSKDNGETEINFSVLGPDGTPLLPHELAVTHTRRIHFMLIDNEMGSYHHLHPESLGNSGDYRVSFVPRSRQYRYFAEFVPLRTRLLSVADGTLQVDGQNISMENHPVAVRFDLQGLDEPLRSNRDHILRLRLENEAEEPLPLEETMDAYAHLVGFEDSLSGYAHMHPLTVDPAIGETAEMEFMFHPTRKGHFRIWVQVRIDGNDIFRPFDVQVI